jgi:trans-o-hydroxybenzylidenepyruvate hydratase-aldolase
MPTREPIRGVIAVVPTPAKEHAGLPDAVGTVDLDETARMVHRLIDDGAAGLMALGTLGECATLSQPDYEAFVDCLLSEVGGRIPTYVGTTSLGTHEVVRRIRFIKERGATGTLLGLPMWQPATLDMAVGFYRSIAKTFPDMPIMVYANARAFRFRFSAEFWSQVTEEAPTVVCSKFSNLPLYAEALRISHGRVQFIPPDAKAMAFNDRVPGSVTACWSAAVGPQPANALLTAIASDDGQTAVAVAKDIEWCNEPVNHITGDPEVFASYNIQLERLKIEASEYCSPGPIRPPYDVIPADYAEAAREWGRRCAVIREKYR